MVWWQTPEHTVCPAIICMSLSASMVVKICPVVYDNATGMQFYKVAAMEISLWDGLEAWSVIT